MQHCPPRCPARSAVCRSGQPRRWLALTLACLAACLSGGAPASALASDARPSAEQEAPGFSLTVRISGLRNARGRVAVALFAAAESFPDQKKALAGKLASISKDRAAVTFTGVRPGVYAVAVLHDENGNSKMDFNFLGMPQEGYGFSNDASAPFGPPSFAAAAFRLAPRPSAIVIQARYLL